MAAADESDKGAGTIVPYESLQPQTLRAVIEEFVTREGTDYGGPEHALTDKVEHVLRQLRRGEAQIAFDPHSGTVGIVPSRRR